MPFKKVFKVNDAGAAELRVNVDGEVASLHWHGSVRSPYQETTCPNSGTDAVKGAWLAGGYPGQGGLGGRQRGPCVKCVHDGGHRADVVPAALQMRRRARRQL